jgi:hypothetical protein
MLHTLMPQKESVSMASHMFKLRHLSAALLAVIATGFAAPPPAIADEDPQVRRPRPPVQRVRTVQTVRTVVRVRTRVVCYDYTGQPFDCRTPAPVAPQPVYQSCGGCAPAIVPAPQYYAPAVVQAPQYYAPAYTSCGGCAPAVAIAPPVQYYGCGGCAQPAVVPYSWSVRYGHYRYRHALYQYRRGHYAYR